ncbi:MAG: hypothetical protein NZT61_06510 [Deltaproteobacteria bacterium]|nr:hypothetical protein [Deltaproteobacteria bacterium]
MQPIRFLCITGPSGVGKSTVTHSLMRLTRLPIKRCPTYTTRPKRPHEVQGVDYHFVSQAEFSELAKKGLLLEVDEYDQYFYGIPFIEPRPDCIITHVVNLNGAKNLKRCWSQMVLSICLLSSFEDIKSRLEAREKTIDKNRLSSRLQIVRNELESLMTIGKFFIDFYVENNELSKTVEKVNQILSLCALS